MKQYFGILIFFFWVELSFATVTMSIDPSQAKLGDTIRLTLTTDDTQSGGVPDLIPLQQDFTIVGTERNMSYTIINGSAKSMGQWIILLTPKKTGLLHIPSIKMGQQQSQPGQIEITKNATTPSNTASDEEPTDEQVMLTASIDNKTPFVNEEIIYTVKLINRQRLLEAAYQPPKVDDALMIPLGDGRHYQTMKNGQSYDVEEQQYAIFPQKAGKLSIVPPSFTAIIEDIFPRRIQTQGNESNLTIQPIPSDLQSNWLPAKNVTLTEKFDKAETTLTKGTTLERSITLQAAGVPTELLPELKYEENQQYDVYSEKPHLQNLLKQQDLIGSSSVKWTYVLNHPGQITIPTVKVTWFNTVTKKQETASLPARTITVPAAAIHKSNLETKLQTGGLVSKPQIGQRFSLADYFTPKILWTALLIIALSISATIGWRWFKRRTLMDGYLQRTVLKRIKKACEENNPIQARAALLLWAGFYWPNKEFLSINDILKVVQDPALQKLLHLLSLTLYRQQDQNTWHGSALWENISKFKPKNEKAKVKEDNLPPIHPQLHR